jgi:HPt (histidine-containing phosphotransfer) domain-containing protein
MSESIEPGKLWNPAVALRRMGSDCDLLCCMVDYFLEDSQLLLRDLKLRIDAGDAPEACRLAHSLKSLCCNIEAEAATQAAAFAESACMEENLDEASASIPPLTEQLHQLSLVLEIWKVAHPVHAE